MNDDDGRSEFDSSVELWAGGPVSTIGGMRMINALRQLVSHGVSPTQRREVLPGCECGAGSPRHECIRVSARGLCHVCASGAGLLKGGDALLKVLSSD